VDDEIDEILCMRILKEPYPQLFVDRNSLTWWCTMHSRWRLWASYKAPREHL